MKELGYNLVVKMKKVGIRQVVLIVLSMMFVALGMIGWEIRKSETPVKIKSIVDGDTLILSNGKTVKLLGVNTYESGSESSMLAKQYLATLLDGRHVWIEYENDMAKAWVGCEASPQFLMSKIKRVENNPIGCIKGTLANDQIVKMGWSK